MERDREVVTSERNGARTRHSAALIFRVFGLFPNHWEHPIVLTALPNAVRSNDGISTCDW